MLLTLSCLGERCSDGRECREGYISCFSQKSKSLNLNAKDARSSRDIRRGPSEDGLFRTSQLICAKRLDIPVHEIFI
jgi:hypothetical protein